jgi:hypothetical protein
MKKQKQHAIIKECADTLWAEIMDAIESGYSYATATIDTADGWIEVTTDSHDDATVMVCHDDSDNERECPVLCDAIEQALPEWADVQAEYDADHDEADNGGLDPAFSSWEDFWNYKGY